MRKKCFNKKTASKKIFQIPLTLDQIKLQFKKLSRNNSLVKVLNKKDKTNVKIDINTQEITNSPTLRRRSTPKKFGKKKIYPINISKSPPLKINRKKKTIRSNTVSEKISEQKIKNDGSQLKICSDYLLDQINRENTNLSIDNNISPTSNELIYNSNKLLKDIENDLYNFKPNIDRENKPREKIKRFIKKEKRKSLKKKLLPIDSTNNLLDNNKNKSKIEIEKRNSVKKKLLPVDIKDHNKSPCIKPKLTIKEIVNDNKKPIIPPKPKMYIKEINNIKKKPDMPPKPKMYIKEINNIKKKPDIPPKPQMYIKEINNAKKKTIIPPKIKTYNYTINIDNNILKNKDQYEIDIKNNNENMHCKHYIDNKGIINETLSFNDTDGSIESPFLFNKTPTTVYRKEIIDLSINKKKFVQNEINRIEKNK